MITCQVAGGELFGICGKTDGCYWTGMAFNHQEVSSDWYYLTDV